METYGDAVDNSFYYGYGDPEQYFSESQSPGSSTYGMTLAIDFTNSNYPSRNPTPDTEENEPGQPTTDQKLKRKRENRYKNAPPAVLSRRRAQNRASQRAYRERKEQRIRDLEHMLNEARQRNDVLSQAYAALHAEYMALKNSQLAVGGDAGAVPGGYAQQQEQVELAYGTAISGAIDFGLVAITNPLGKPEMFGYDPNGLSGGYPF